MNQGAEFLRADLHIHSYGEEFGSYDVQDNTNTPEGIVDTAIEKGLSIISITDHNEIQNSNTAINYAKGKDILVIAGIEVTTTQGHLLLYFETFSDLRSFFGTLKVSQDKKTTTQGIVECLNNAQINNGFGVLAHIEIPAGFEQTIGRFGPQMEQVFQHPNLLGLEINSKTSITRYTDEDDSDDRKRLIKLRRTSLTLEDNYNLAKLMSSDSHTLERLGTNADGENKLTRIKVDEPNFHAFKIALINQESRIRLEDFIPEKRPIIKTVKLEGGLLDGQEIVLSRNLTCIIGSRGAGKSTLIETIKNCTGNISNSRVIDSEVWPQKISISYEDETGRKSDFTREKHSTNQNITDPINGITKVDIESYGQGETAETLQHSDKNPKVLIDFLDEFLDLKAYKEEEWEVISKLRENQSEQRKRRLELLALPETDRTLKNENSKLDNLKKEKAGELVEYQNGLIKERQIRNEIISDLKNLIETYKELFNDKTIFEEFEKLTDDEIIVGKDQFAKVKALVDSFAKTVSSKSQELNTVLSEKIKEIKIQLKEWGAKEKEIQAKIDAKKIDLESKGIPFDLGKINQISKDIIDLTARVKHLLIRKKELLTLQTKRTELLKRRKELRDKIYYTRHAFATDVNSNLKNTIDDLLITLKYHQGRFSNQFEELLRQKFDWRTTQVQRTNLILNFYNPLEFLDFCKRKNVSALQAIKDAESNQVLSNAEINRISSIVNADFCFEDFEIVEFDDMPEILITKLFKDEDGNQIRQTKNLSQLSLGQQQSVLLGILMLSKSNKPLIIDQPEDNLDSEFIYKTIVKNLRTIKEKRQVIIVTHNANIAVLGDAELIIPLKSINVKSHILDAGSIERSETRLKCCEILEGGKIAFTRRKEIYGI